MLYIYNISHCLKDNARWVLRGQCIYYDTGTCMDSLDATAANSSASKESVRELARPRHERPNAGS